MLFNKTVRKYTTMENIFWIIVIFLCSGLGAYIFSLLFDDKYKPAIFSSCVLGIPGLFCAYAGIKGILKLFSGSMKISFDNLVGLGGVFILAIIFISFPIAAFKAFKDD